MPAPSSIQFNDDRGIDVQIPRYAKTVLALAITAAFSACALQTERSSSGPGASGRTTAPPVPPKAAEYESAQYASPPDYEPPQYVEPPPVVEAEPEAPPVMAEEEEAEEEEEIAAEEEPEEEPVAVIEEAEPEVAERAAPQMPEFVEEEEEEEAVEEAVAEEEEPVAVTEEAEPEVAEAPAPEMPEFAEEEEEEEAVAEEEEPVAAAEEPAPEPFTAPPPEMPEFAEEEEEPAEEAVAEQPPAAPPQEESVVTHEEEPGVATDDGIISQSQYYDEESVEQEDGIVSQSQYHEEEEGKQPADTISEAQQTDEVMATQVEPEPAAQQQEPPAQEEQVAQQEEPKPLVLPVTITLEAEPWFDFDRSVVRSDARAKLDELLDGLQQVEYDSILVVGHADRIGTRTYNQALSERRANSVKNYLAGKGVPADRIKTEGRGEFEPSTDPNACTGRRKQQLIDCLQPDRRVEVTVTGQRMSQ
jgi:OOP family OmpA-OmpF porin